MAEEDHFYCQKKSKGFTLIELLTVIAILSILAGVALISLTPSAQFQKANDARRKSDLEQIQRALEAYNQDNNGYPASTGSGGTPPYNIQNGLFGQSWSNYMSKVPGDPKSSKAYVYIVSNDKQSYWLYASLDRTNDPQACSGGGNCPHAPNGVACGNVCNYGVSSSNTTP